MKNVFIAFALLITGTLFAQEPNKELILNNETNLIEATYFHEDGSVKQKGYFTKEGKLHGDWISFDVNGKKNISGKYNNGVKTGKWFFWSKNELKEVDYSNNSVAGVNIWVNQGYAITE